MKIFNTEADLAAASLGEGQLVRTKGYTSADDGQGTLWRIATTGQGVTLANGNVAVPYVNEKSGRKNLVINGGYNIWQRGTSFANVAVAYTADRFYTSGNRSIDRSTDLPNDPEIITPYSCLCTGGAGANAQTITAIELPLIGTAGVFKPNSIFTLSFWIRDNGAGGSDIRARVRFVDDSLGGTPTDIVPVDVIKQSVAGAWEKVTYTFDVGAAVPTAGNQCVDLLIDLVDPAGSFNITQIQLEEGPVATEFEPRTVGEELALCQRYYQHSGATFRFAADRDTSSVRVLNMNFLVGMRVNPAIVFLNAVGFSGGPNWAGSSQNFVSTGTATGNTTIATIDGYTADAEL